MLALALQPFPYGDSGVSGDIKELKGSSSLELSQHTGERQPGELLGPQQIMHEQEINSCHAEPLRSGVGPYAAQAAPACLDCCSPPGGRARVCVHPDPEQVSENMPP